MSPAPLVLLALAQIPDTGFSKQSRGFFEKLIDIKLEGQTLVFKAPAGFPDVSSLRELAYSHFPDVGRVYVRSSNGSTSSSRGGSGGEVRITLNQGGNESFEFLLTAPSGDESIVLRQGSAGELTLDLRRPRLTIHFEQQKGRCKLQIKGSGEGMSTTRTSLSEVFSVHPVETRKYFIGALEAYFDKPPFIAFAAAPPGVTIVRLRDGAEIFGEIQMTALELKTAYGALSIPRNELVQVLFEGAEGAAAKEPRREAVIVTKRFAPRGELQIESFRVKTSYGELEVSAADVVHLAFGPEKVKDPPPVIEAEGR